MQLFLRGCSIKTGLEIPDELKRRINIRAAELSLKMKDITVQAFEGWLAGRCSENLHPESGGLSHPVNSEETTGKHLESIGEIVYASNQIETLEAIVMRIIHEIRPELSEEDERLFRDVLEKIQVSVTFTARGAAIGAQQQAEGDSDPSSGQVDEPKKFRGKSNKQIGDYVRAIARARGIATGNRRRKRGSDDPPAEVRPAKPSRTA